MNTMKALRAPSSSTTRPSNTTKDRKASLRHVGSDCAEPSLRGGASRSIELHVAPTRTSLIARAGASNGQQAVKESKQVKEEVKTTLQANAEVGAMIKERAAKGSSGIHGTVSSMSKVAAEAGKDVREGGVSLLELAAEQVKKVGDFVNGSK